LIEAGEKEKASITLQLLAYNLSNHVLRMKNKPIILLINFVHEENGRKTFRRRKEFPKIICSTILDRSIRS
jgi:hypothetical protein